MFFSFSVTQRFSAIIVLLRMKWYKENTKNMKATLNKVLVDTQYLINNHICLLNIFLCLFPSSRESNLPIFFDMQHNQVWWVNKCFLIISRLYLKHKLKYLLSLYLYSEIVAFQNISALIIKDIQHGVFIYIGLKSIF